MSTETDIKRIIKMMQERVGSEFESEASFSEEEVERIVAALSSMVWQPIETADKTRIVWVGHVSGVRDIAYFKSAGFWANPYTNIPIDFRPTHWMPAPDAPTRKEGEVKP